MAQQLKTDSQEIDLNDLPDLSAAEQIFVERILVGDKSSEAYRIAYPHHAQEWESGSISTAACKLRNRAHIVAWIHAGRMAGLEKIGSTVEAHIADLHRLSHAAEAAGNYGAAVQAEKLKGEAQGFYISRYEDITKGVNEKELLAKLRQLLGPDAQPIADRLGLKESEDHVSH